MTKNNNGDIDFDWDAVDKLMERTVQEKASHIPGANFRVDHSALYSYLYPFSKEVATRVYQKSIVRASLFSNTLVSLPTGLGKTFIASAIILNYHRWFPDSSIIFVAHTKPLVRQQHAACLSFFNFKDTSDPSLRKMESFIAVLDGSTLKRKREGVWKSKRIFFSTPQTVQSDLDIIDKSKISLVVVDEAHKATGSYAYSTIVDAISAENPWVRVLALSATPGKDVEHVQEVVDKLNITQMEYRSEEHPEVAPYIFQKKIEVIKADKCEELRGLTKQLDVLINGVLKDMQDVAASKGGEAHRLVASIPRSASSLSWGSINTCDVALKEGQDVLFGEEKTKMKCQVYLLMSLARCRKFLQQQGIESFLTACKSSFNPASKSFPLYNKPKLELVKSDGWKNLVQSVKDAKGSGLINQKLLKLSQVLSEHFTKFGMGQHPGSTSAIVFASDRATITMIVDYLNENTDLRVDKFIGQQASSDGGQGQKQKEQKAVIEDFRNNEVDVIVSTVIGEEGLDVGSVDFIVCFDTSSSPIRNTQRFGRAGRKRDGRIVMLVNDDSEKCMFSLGQSKSKSIHNVLRKAKEKINFSDETMANNVFLLYGVNRSEVKMEPIELGPEPTFKYSTLSSPTNSATTSKTNKLSKTFVTAYTTPPKLKNKGRKNYTNYSRPVAKPVLCIESDSDNASSYSQKLIENLKPRNSPGEASEFSPSPVRNFKRLRRKRIKPRKIILTSEENKTIEDNYFEAEADASSGFSGDEDEHDIDSQDEMSSFFDDRPTQCLTQAPLTPHSGQTSANDPPSPFDHRRQTNMMMQSQTPTFLRNAKKYGMSLKVLGDEFDKVKSKKVRKVVDFCDLT